MSGWLETGSDYFAGIAKHIFKPAPSPVVKELVEKVIVKEMHGMGSAPRFFVRVAGLSGAVAVALGAYGAHAFIPESEEEQKLKKIYETGNRYHFLHSIALLGSPLCRRPVLVGTLITTGMVLFSGSCYYHALTGSTKIRRITPYGGIILIFGWLAMLL